MRWFLSSTHPHTTESAQPPTHLNPFRSAWAVCPTNGRMYHRHSFAFVKAQDRRCQKFAILCAPEKKRDVLVLKVRREVPSKEFHCRHFVLNSAQHAPTRPFLFCVFGNWKGFSSCQRSLLAELERLKTLAPRKRPCQKRPGKAV